ncbi:MAG: hypothetical protein BHV99_05310 [Clostridium sp. 26_21]|nr:MAG: hypothetical protein BHV99_05310 [Clostridium sp. 26_21]
MEELINELDIFVNEKAVLSAQIRDIESKRNELAKERNTKKAQNKINNDEDVWSEVNCLGKQISDLGNQSQWFQNQINSKLLRVREQAFIEIDNLIAESVRKSRIISEQIEENRDNLDPEEIYELTDNINEIGQSMARIMFAKRLIKHNQIVDVINLFSTTEIEESQEQSEQINEIIEKQEIENKEENEQVQLINEELKPIEEIAIDPVLTDYYNNINEITKNLEKEIITLEESEENQLVNTNTEEPTTIKNIVVKVENGELIYKAELSNETTIKIYPIKEKILEKEKFERETWKRELIEYSAKNYRNLRNIAIKKMDPIVCEILDRYAVQYDMDSQNLVYNYVMSFSSIDDYDSDILPAITYNLSYINEAKISKKEIRTLQKIVKNSTQNALVDIIGNVTLSEKIKCFMKKIFNISSANILPEGNKE